MKVDSVGALDCGDIGLARSSCSMGVAQSALWFILTFHCVSCNRFLRTGLGETSVGGWLLSLCPSLSLSLSELRTSARK